MRVIGGGRGGELSSLQYTTWSTSIATTSTATTTTNNIKGEWTSFALIPTEGIFHIEATNTHQKSIFICCSGGDFSNKGSSKIMV